MRLINQRSHSFIVLLLIMGLLFLFSCQENSDPLSVDNQEQMADIEGCAKGDFGPKNHFGRTVKFAVFSDPHLYDPALGTSGEAFQWYLAQDRKMLAESQAILEAVVAEIISSDVQYVIVPGDLTKDGELLCHNLMAMYLAQIEEAGKQVFVVPGNHDIDNPHSFGFSGADIVPAEDISSSDFETIYAEYGFNEAIYRDENSLSYIVEPQPGLWFLGLDGCNYEGRFPDLTLTDGRIAPETLEWLKQKLVYAKRMRINVIAFMHHGVIEHFPEMESVFPEYLIDGWTDVSKFLMKRGVRMVFTGHHHANDISIINNGVKKLYDIQTGSLVTWPSPYRIVNYNTHSREADIDTRYVEEINFDLEGADFQQYAYNFLDSGLPPIVVGYLQQLGVPEAMAMQLEQLVTPTLMAYYHGDEPDMTNPALMAEIMQLINMEDPMAVNFGYLLLGIWTDSSLDNDVILDLNRSMPWAKNH